MKAGKDSVNLTEYGRDIGAATATKVAIAILGIGIVTGTALVIAMDQIMKRIFVSDSWPEEEWSNNEWAGEDLE